MHKFLFLSVLTLCLPAACTQFPALDGSVTPELRDAAYPDIVPLGSLLAQADAARGAPRAGPAVQDALEDRVARLRARAERLRGPVIEAPIKARMQRGL